MAVAIKEIEKSCLWPQEVLVAHPHGFCAGVVRAIDALNKAKVKVPRGKIFSYHQIIHNRHVVREFEDRGVRFVDNLEDVPQGAVLVLSAHGVSPEVRRQADKRKLRVVDATCPLVDKTHREAVQFSQKGFTILYIGHAGHDETIGTIGEANGDIILIQNIKEAEEVEIADPKKVALITQTTLSQDDTAKITDILRQRFPGIIEPPKQDICYATQHRQDGVKEMIRNGARVVVIIGSQNSSNSKRLKEAAESLGARAYLVDDISEINQELFYGYARVGLTSGASAPEEKFQELMNWFRERGSVNFINIVVADEKKITFSQPVGIN